MSAEEAMIAGAEADGVHIVHRRDRFPIPGTKAEKRAERGVAAHVRARRRWPASLHRRRSSRCRTTGTCPAPPQNFRFYTPVARRPARR